MQFWDKKLMANFPAEYIPFDRRVKDLLKGIGIISAIAAVLNYVWFFYQDPKLIGTWTGIVIVGLVLIWFAFLWIWRQIDSLSRRIMSPTDHSLDEDENISAPPPEALKQAFPATSDGVGGLLSVEKYQFASKIIFGYMRYNRIQKNNPAHIKELSDRSNGLLRDFEINLALDQLIAEGQLHLEGNDLQAGEAEIRIIDWTLINNVFEAVKCEYWSLDKSLGDERFEMAKNKVLNRFKYKSVEKWFDINSELLDVIHTYDEKKAVTTVSYDDVTGELEL
jgi:hypothetical protein